MRAGIWQRFRVHRPIRSRFRLAAASRRAARWQVRIACLDCPKCTWLPQVTRLPAFTTTPWCGASSTSGHDH